MLPTPKQLSNGLSLMRMALNQFAADGANSEEAVAEVAADLVAVKLWMAEHMPAEPAKA